MKGEVDRLTGLVLQIATCMAGEMRPVPFKSEIMPLFNIVTSTSFTISSSFSFGPNTLSSVYVPYCPLYALYSCVVEAV